MMNKPEIIVYKNIKYRRYQESTSWSSKYYYVPNGKYRKNGVGRLHQEIWKDNYGDIPDGYVIHHIDGNPLNNNISNLKCVELKEHSKNHYDGFPEWLKSWLRNRFPIVQEKAKNWHKSKEGRAWHSSVAKLMWKEQIYRTETCEYCGAEYKTRSMRKNDRFCSNSCKSAYRRKMGFDDQIYKCQYCGNKFVKNKYSEGNYCSNKCQGLARWKFEKENGIKRNFRFTPAHRQKISDGVIRSMTPESKKARSDAAKKRWAKWRADKAAQEAINVNT